MCGRGGGGGRPYFPEKKAEGKMGSSRLMAFLEEYFFTVRDIKKMEGETAFCVEGESPL